jgi:hypothetical protein
VVPTAPLVPLVVRLLEVLTTTTLAVATLVLTIPAWQTRRILALTPIWTTVLVTSNWELAMHLLAAAMPHRALETLSGLLAPTTPTS